MNEYYWVPEEMLFHSDGECLDAHPDLGPASLVANHVNYDTLKKRLEEAKSAFQEVLLKQSILESAERTLQAILLRQSFFPDGFVETLVKAHFKEWKKDE